MGAAASEVEGGAPSGAAAAAEAQKRSEDNRGESR